MKLQINAATCTRCGKCTRVCPAGIFIHDKETKSIRLEQENSCIACGHCVDVCLTDSVKHSEFPPEKIHTIDFDNMPSPDQVMELIKSRRSNRSMTNQPVPREVLEKIIEAAHYAPTASNAQMISFTLVTDPEKLRFTSDYTIGVFTKVASFLLNPVVKCITKPFMSHVYKYVPAFQRLQKEHKAGHDPILRKATALLFIHSPQSNRFGCEDANLAYQNASLMAQSLGVSQIYMGFILTAIKQDGKNTLAKEMGIEGKIHAIMALGIPAFTYSKYADRKEIRCKFTP